MEPDENRRRPEKVKCHHPSLPQNDRLPFLVAEFLNFSLSRSPNSAAVALAHSAAVRFLLKILPALPLKGSRSSPCAGEARVDIPEAVMSKFSINDKVGGPELGCREDLPREQTGWGAPP